MNRFLYNPQDLAYIICARNMGIKDSAKFVKYVFQYEKLYLPSQYKNNFRNFQLDILHWSNYLSDQDTYDREFPKVNEDLASIGSDIILEDGSYYNDFEIFFKNLRLRIIYLEHKNYVTIKLRTLLSKYGYIRRSEKINYFLKQCLYFYHITATLRGNTACDIEKVNLDNFVTFRLAE